MIDWGAIEETFLTWLSSQTGRPVVPANHSSPEPELPYLTFEIKDVSLKGKETRMHPAENAVALEIRDEWQFTVAISCHGGETVDPESGKLHLLTKIQTSLAHPPLLQPLFDAGLSFIDSSTIQDQSSLEDGERVERKQLDARFALASSRMETVECIATVEVEQEGGA